MKTEEKAPQLKAASLLKPDNNRGPGANRLRKNRRKGGKDEDWPPDLNR
jgi:hypothetical protein